MIHTIALSATLVTRGDASRLFYPPRLAGYRRIRKRGMIHNFSSSPTIDDVTCDVHSFPAFSGDHAGTNFHVG